MNCKPGDLAVHVICAFPQNIGALYRIVDTYRCVPGEWRVETLTHVQTNMGPRQPGQLVWADDAQLRPLRDPGSDAIDETLIWKPVPVQQKETA